MAKETPFGQKRLLSTKEAARYCGIGVRTLRKEFWSAEYHFTTVNIRKYDVFRLDEIIDKSTDSPITPAVSRWLERQSPAQKDHLRWHEFGTSQR
ncbi:hypothetical protein NKI95_32090 [Mesorhizobium sp. M0306]|uniref:hypothetical protein n=1 Tax=Mesorhizobium sp. M0306 TaxID=2956932 RepID=UPI00333C4E3F